MGRCCARVIDPAAKNMEVSATAYAILGFPALGEHRFGGSDRGMFDRQCVSSDALGVRRLSATDMCILGDSADLSHNSCIGRDAVGDFWSCRTKEKPCNFIRGCCAYSGGAHIVLVDSGGFRHRRTLSLGGSCTDSPHHGMRVRTVDYAVTDFR